MNELAGEPFQAYAWEWSANFGTVDGLFQRHADAGNQFGFRRAVRTIAVDLQGRRGAQPLSAVGEPYAEDLPLDFRQSRIRSDMADHGGAAARDGLETDPRAGGEYVIGGHGS